MIDKKILFLMFPSFRELFHYVLKFIHQVDIISWHFGLINLYYKNHMKYAVFRFITFSSFGYIHSGQEKGTRGY